MKIALVVSIAAAHSPAYVVPRSGDTMGKTLATLLFALMLIVGGSTAYAGPLEDGIAAVNRGDYST